jgi:hypothetical protein
VVTDGCPGGLDQDGLQAGVAVARLAGMPLAGRFVVARAQAGPGGQAGGAGEELEGTGPDLGNTAAAASAAMPGMVVSRSRSARKGEKLKLCGLTVNESSRTGPGSNNTNRVRFIAGPVIDLGRWFRLPRRDLRMRIQRSYRDWRFGLPHDQVATP